MYGVGFNNAFGEERPGPAPLIPAPLCHPGPPHRHMQKRTHSCKDREKERDPRSKHQEDRNCWSEEERDQG